VTDKLRSYGVAHRELISETIHSTTQYENTRAKQSHEGARVRERVMRGFKSVGQAQRFLGANAVVNFFYHDKVLPGENGAKVEHFLEAPRRCMHLCEPCL
jgi:transposase-like protein